MLHCISYCVTLSIAQCSIICIDTHSLIRQSPHRLPSKLVVIALPTDSLTFPAAAAAALTIVVPPGACSWGLPPVPKGMQIWSDDSGGSAAPVHAPIDKEDVRLQASGEALYTGDVMMGGGGSTQQVYAAGNVLDMLVCWAGIAYLISSDVLFILACLRAPPAGWPWFSEVPVISAGNRCVLCKGAEQSCT